MFTIAKLSELGIASTSKIMYNHTVTQTRILSRFTMAGMASCLAGRALGLLDARRPLTYNPTSLPAPCGSRLGDTLRVPAPERVASMLRKRLSPFVGVGAFAFLRR